jgi:hypothetical protein
MPFRSLVSDAWAAGFGHFSSRIGVGEARIRSADPG